MGLIGDRQPGVGAIGALALDHGLKILEVLREIRNELKLMREHETGKRHFELLYGGMGESGVVLTLQPTEPIPQGFKFIPEHISAMAPAGAKLQLFENRNNPANFIEVVANIQEYANVTAGLIVEGPNVILAVISGMTANGAVTIRVSGQLTKKLPSESV